ncbi:MAG: molybdopterin-binding protein [Neisseria sp.]|nr:molybdopterin-binding protein [Neisseria sp.]
MYFNLIIIGDEILHGSRIDKHFAFFKSLLEQHGLRLHQVQYLPDNPGLLVKQLRRSFSDGLPTFVTGGIGGTPDDHTRQAAAEALSLPIRRHPEAARLIEAVSLKRGDALDSAEHEQRLTMADFPQGAELIPNSYNTIAGFSIKQHYFFPGFPVMAHPMAEWVLNTYYTHLFHQIRTELRSIWVYGLPESRVAPIMVALEQNHPGIHAFSLPSEGGSLDINGHKILPHIEFGIKAEGEACALIDSAWAEVKQQLIEIGGSLQEAAPEK